MVSQDFIVIFLLLSILLWAIFHQLASKYIINSAELKKTLYGTDLYKNRSIDLMNIETSILAIIFINTVYIFSKGKFSSIFDNHRFLFHYKINSESALNIVKNHKRLWTYIKISSFFGLMIISNTILFFYI